MAKDSIDETGLSEAEKSRREFIKAAGKLAVYTPPALMLLMRPTPNAIAASAGGYQHTDTDGDDGYEDKDGNLVGAAPDQDNGYRHDTDKEGNLVGVAPDQD